MVSARAVVFIESSMNQAVTQNEAESPAKTYPQPGSCDPAGIRTYSSATKREEANAVIDRHSRGCSACNRRSFNNVQFLDCHLFPLLKQHNSMSPKQRDMH